MQLGRYRLGIEQDSHVNGQIGRDSIMVKHGRICSGTAISPAHGIRAMPRSAESNFASASLVSQHSAFIHHHSRAGILDRLYVVTPTEIWQLLPLITRPTPRQCDVTALSTVCCRQVRSPPSDTRGMSISVDRYRMS